MESNGATTYKHEYEICYSYKRKKSHNKRDKNENNVQWTFTNEWANDSNKIFRNKHVETKEWKNKLKCEKKRKKRRN